MKRHKVTIVDETNNQSETFDVRHGFGFQAICKKHKTPIEYDCRKSDCGVCIMKVEAGLENLSPPTESEKDFLQAMKAGPDERLACQTRVFGDTKIVIEDLGPGVI